tara:strand:+ start:476 stop:823 length:348 start_codon:yes stop_codon:yes gene_type:complete
MANQRTIDLLVGSFDLNERRKFTLKKADGTPIVDLFFKPITRSNRVKVQSIANSEDALKQSTAMLCEMAELEDGTKAFAHADSVKLQRELPESVLNELELFLFGVEENIDQVKND